MIDSPKSIILYILHMYVLFYLVHYDGTPSVEQHSTKVRLLLSNNIAWLNKSMFCETSPLLYWLKNLLCYYVIHGSNINSYYEFILCHNRGAVFRVLEVLGAQLSGTLSHLANTTNVTDRVAVVRHSRYGTKHCFFNLD